MERIEARGTNGTLRFDGEFLEIERAKGNRGSHRVGTKRVPLAAISAVQINAPTWVLNGFIQFAVHGQEARSSRRAGGIKDAAEDENTVLFQKKDMPTFQVFGRSVEQAIARHSAPQPQTARAPLAPPQMVLPPPDTAAPSSGLIGSELAKLAELYQSGVLSADEFAQAKRRLLG